ncbi:hypothetical protein M501DRAFT_1017481 [Patellaria atrata CBS 101060]|uniref:Peroxisomal membrane protein PEX14 n=1 Tax=Patellaria atrata CBS 101060 TaxID=1346257 RepID=A0A9P4S9F4_9PEZI|nr:hypothetical protein M501DRAFT_1017481 [Patellaria atrata CBS 101060]
MVREDLISSAVTFLIDPSVASAPLEKRIAFLQSKNLTQEEIDIALARAGDDSGTATPATPSSSGQPSYRQPPPPPPGYGGYQSPGYWQQPPPPPLPKRDWRDWFIMATVMGGVSYGLYFTVKRYIIPLIKPPTPPQLEQDKAAIDEQFNRAFALIEQVNTDTAALKASEDARTQRLDSALIDLESVLGSLKDASKRQDDEARRLNDDIRSLRELIPKAIDAQKESTDGRLRELGNELKSLKTLIGNRLSQPQPQQPRPSSISMPGPNIYGSQNASSTAVNGIASGAATPSTSGGPVGAATESLDGSATSTMPERAQTSSPYGRLANGKAAIPAWQMAAKKNQEKKDTSESGTVTEATA